MINDKFENKEIRKRIRSHKYASGFTPAETLIDSILDQFWFHDFYNSFISDGMLLDYLLKYLDEKQPKAFNRNDFYKFFFDQISPDKGRRRMLHVLALRFEQFQSDRIPYTKFTKLLRSINLSILVFPLFLKKVSLGKVETIDSERLFIWNHHTLTEFLVAEYLLQQKNPLEEFQKLAILEKDGVTAFKPSWGGVLRFLLESPKGTETLHWLLSFLNEHKDNVDDNLSELLVFVDTDMSPPTRKKIFELIYNSYFDRIVWLPVWARSRIAKFVDEELYDRLKKDIREWSNTTETFVRRGNVVSIVEGLFEAESKLLTPREKRFWKNTLIKFANNPNDDGNGVLQRHSLSTLAYFKDDKIIPLVADKCFEETQDSLVRDEFIQFCIKSAPDSTNTIDYLIKGIKKGSTIYARHGLYKITSKKAIEYLLSKVSKDEEFLKTFLKHESIFDKEGADKELIANIVEQASPKVIKKLKELIFTVFRIDDYYKEGQSNFLRQIARLIYKHDLEYIFEVLSDIKNEKDEQKIDKVFYDSKELLAVLLTKENVKQYFSVLEEFPSRTKRDAQYAIYFAKQINGKIGEQAYQEAVKLRLIEEIKEARSQKHLEELEAKRKQDIVENFQKLLDSSPGKYNPGVFEYYLNNRKELDEFFKTKNGTKFKKRLIRLAVDKGIKKINPQEIKVSIPDKEVRQFTWSSVASYYGNILSIVKIFAPEEIEKNRQHIIDFIPYAFSNDMSLILDLFPKTEDEELAFVNKIMSDSKDDRRYLTPGSYVYIVGQYAKNGCNLPSAKSVLSSFIGDKDIPDYEQRAALENLALFVDDSDKKTRTFLRDVFEKSEDKELSKAANALLIAVYKDEDSIDWRFTQLRTPIEFDKRRIEGIAHSVGPEERELDTLAIAKPLIDLRDEKYLPKFFDLLTYSFEVIEEKRNKKYWEYVNYLWRIVIEFVENLKEKGSLKPLLTLEKWVSENTTYENSNWLTARVRKLRAEYINNISKSKLTDIL